MTKLAPTDGWTIPAYRLCTNSLLRNDEGIIDFLAHVLESDPIGIIILHDD